MDKAILVIDMPSRCGECPVCASYQSCAFSTREVWCAATGKDVDLYSKSIWCPLKEVPDKRDERGTWTVDGYIEDRYTDGWNECIEEILSGDIYAK